MRRENKNGRKRILRIYMSLRHLSINHLSLLFLKGGRGIPYKREKDTPYLRVVMENSVTPDMACPPWSTERQKVAVPSLILPALTMAV
jgi:hypothetical protein